MILKKHYNEGRIILALCDSDIIGERFEEGDAILELDSDFYKGNETSDKDALEIIKGAYIINAVGESVISLLIKHTLLSENEIKRIKGIPYAQIIFE